MSQATFWDQPDEPGAPRPTQAPPPNVPVQTHRGDGADVWCWGFIVVAVGIALMFATWSR